MKENYVTYWKWTFNVTLIWENWWGRFWTSTSIIQPIKSINVSTVQYSTVLVRFSFKYRMRHDPWKYPNTPRKNSGHTSYKELPFSPLDSCVTLSPKVILDHSTTNFTVNSSSITKTIDLQERKVAAPKYLLSTKNISTCILLDLSHLKAISHEKENCLNGRPMSKD